jgi:2-polyprenyl-6-methoxyphenol hydroxylase-like FAD-dependent oxidoreductase
MSDEHGYAKGYPAGCGRCKALEDVVLGLEGLLAAYRLGSPSRADAALRKLEKARMALAQINLDRTPK